MFRVQTIRYSLTRFVFCFIVCSAPVSIVDCYSPPTIIQVSMLRKQYFPQANITAIKITFLNPYIVGSPGCLNL